MFFTRVCATTVCALGLATSAFAAGSGSDSKPKTVFCTGGKVYSEEKGKCVPKQDSSLTDEDRMKTIRSLAYADRNAEAQTLLAMMQDQESDLALTYWGFTHRKLGNVDAAMIFYDKALQQNPDNLLARSYLGQAHVVSGRLDLARAELTEIRDRGGEGGWPEASLEEAIRTGTTFNY